MSVLKQALAHFEARPTLVIDVPEWGQGGKPLTLYYRTPNAALLAKVTRESKGDVVEQLARLVAASMLDANGERVFHPMEYKELMIGADPAVLARLANAIMAEAKLDDAATEAAEKN